MENLGYRNGDEKLITAFKEKYNLKEVEIAFVLDVSRSQITNWKTGHRPMPWSIRARIADHIGLIGVRDFVLLFLDCIEHERLLFVEKNKLALSPNEMKLARNIDSKQNK